jgi:hypothetical protein
MDVNLISDWSSSSLDVTTESKAVKPNIATLSKPVLHPFTIAMYGDIEMHMNWQIVVDYQISVDKQLKLLSFSICEIDFAIGFLPVEIDVLLQIWVEIAASFEAHINVTLDSNVTGSIHGGITYDSPSNSWNRFGSRDIASASFDPIISDQISMLSFFIKSLQLFLLFETIIIFHN